jgi:hypothetical protein
MFFAAAYVSIFICKHDGVLQGSDTESALAIRLKNVKHSFYSSQ